MSNDGSRFQFSLLTLFIASIAGGAVIIFRPWSDGGRIPSVTSFLNFATGVLCIFLVLLAGWLVQGWPKSG